jgi:predicted phosphodiesterase
MTKKVYKSLSSKYPYSRSRCACGKLTTKLHEGEYICKDCLMALEDKLSPDQKKKLSLLDDLSVGEIKQLLKTTPQHTQKRNYNHNYGKHIRVGILSDTHIGHSEFDEDLLKYAGETFKKEKVQAVYHAGDILEGMSGRDGHVYELGKVGFSQQINYAVQMFKKYFKGIKMYGITGNHDLWYKIRNNGGIDVGEELQSRLGKDNFEYLGEYEADIKLAPNCIMKLFHPNDGTAYATSYKLQKLIESFEGGKKPHIVVEGHYHKALYMFSRNVHGLEAGTLCGQTGFMRGKKIPAHKGFYILDFEIGERGITKFSPQFYPAYD